jgi:hypothetical protein
MATEIKKKKKVNPSPLPNSMRTQKRHNRGWQSLAQSSRKHRRAARRSLVSRSIDNRLYVAGEHAATAYTGLTQHAGGSLNYNR